MRYLLIYIYKFFTKYDPKNQDRKLDEEVNEFNVAYEKYRHMPNYENFVAMMKEMVDCNIIIKQKALCKYGLNLSEIEGEEKNKVSRTVDLIAKCNGDPGRYEEVRYER